MVQVVLGIYNDVTQSSTTGSGTGFSLEVVTDGSSTPTITITNGGSGHAAGDDITINGSQLGSSSNLTFNVVSASVGDVVYVKARSLQRNFTRKFVGVTVQGESH